MKARVDRVEKKSFICYLSAEQQQVRATVWSKVNATRVVVGDYVELEKVEDKFKIKSIYPRQNEIFRIIPRIAKKRVSAANCDVVVITTSVDNPQYKRGVVDRFLLRAIQWEIHPIVIFNKMDLFAQQFDLRFEQDRLAALGVNCFTVSAANTTDQSLMALRDYLRHKTAIFLGQSGVGKSALISALSAGKILLKSKQIGKKGKGAHTTTWSEIIRCQDLSFIDSPGIRSFSLDDFLPEQLINYFPDLFEIAQHCRYRDCSHQIDAVGCAFGQLDDSYASRLIRSRLESYLRFYAECLQLHKWEKKKF